ncbi:hypothetical protein OBBRIDRAFT_244909 [Obba rivulosa]|uniref:F-box domain-containing protein n=1 Tax=Obba rivulosa TaxID=1052685 RepID=A0A8E2AQ61_9APHY|nr:hypothetical protein OBBRIDRAFT_244909 [Obba rivulosa]
MSLDPQSTPSEIQDANFKLWEASLKDLRSNHMSMRHEQIEKLHLELALSKAVLCRAHNDTLPISRLPPEILTHIFYYIPSPSRSTTRKEVIWVSDMFRLEDVIALTAVCSRWRDIIVNTAILWSSLNDNPWPGFLERSRGVNLRYLVKQRSRAMPLPDAHELFAANGPRISEIQIMAHESLRSVYTPLEHYVQVDALQFLSMRGIFTFPTLFASSIPHLRNLTLRNCSGIPKGPLPCLIQLSLTAIKGASCADVLNLLSHAPSIQDLHLVNTLSFIRGIPLPVISAKA